MKAQFIRRGAAALAAVGAAATLAAAGTGQLAQADPTPSAPYSARGGHLLTPQEVAIWGEASKISSTLDLMHGLEHGIGACSGETRIGELVPDENATAADDAMLVHLHPGTVNISQVIVTQDTAAHSKKTYKKVLASEKSCQHEVPGHWRYGKAHRVQTSKGVATWLGVEQQDGTANLAFIVARSGHTVSYVEIDQNDSRSDALLSNEQASDQLARQVISDLAD